MPYTHPLDRMAVKFRPALIAVAALCFPVFLFSYALMIKAAFEAWPWWGTTLMAGSHLMGWLGLSALFDNRQEQKSRSEVAQP